MSTGLQQHSIEKRLILPAYPVVDAARYAKISVGTINNWQETAIGARERGESLSYLQLVELRFVAAMREAGLKLRTIRSAREYLSKKFETAYPFADMRLMHDGQNILVDLEELEGEHLKDTILVASRGGQYAWKPVIGDKFVEFDYVDCLARRWYIAGRKSPIVVDPHVAFGAPNVRGIATWALKNRHDG